MIIVCDKIRFIWKIVFKFVIFINIDWYIYIVVGIDIDGISDKFVGVIFVIIYVIEFFYIISVEFFFLYFLEIVIYVYVSIIIIIEISVLSGSVLGFVRIGVEVFLLYNLVG